MSAPDGTEALIPDAAQVWCQTKYTDFKSWVALPYEGSGKLNPTPFTDRRLKFLVAQRDPPAKFQSVVSNEYSLQTWEKDECAIVIEADTNVYMAFPGIEHVAVFRSQSRLPVLAKTWKPIVFMLNPSIFSIRVTEDLALLVTRESTGSDKFIIEEVNFNKGFACVHPVTDTAYLYGAYATGCKSDNNSKVIPYHSCTKSSWGFFVHFFHWGCLVVPKGVEVSQPSFFGGCLGGMSKWTNLAYLFVPPNIYFGIQLVIPAKTSRVLQYGSDFAITCKKLSDYEVEIYLLLEGRLAVSTTSFDVRLNKPGANAVCLPVKFKIFHPPESTDWHIVQAKDVKTILDDGGPIDNIGHLMCSDLIAIFDAEIGQYATAPFCRSVPVFNRTLTSQMTQTIEEPVTESKREESP